MDKRTKPGDYGEEFINIYHLSLADFLAEQGTIDNLKEQGKIKDESEIWQDETGEQLTDEAQDIYNDYYVFYLHSIDNFKLDGEKNIF